MKPPARVLEALARVRTEAQPRVADAPKRRAIDPALVVNATARVLQQQRMVWEIADEELSIEVAAALLITFGVEPVRPPAGYQAIERPDELDRSALKRSVRALELPGDQPGKTRPRLLR